MLLSAPGTASPFCRLFQVFPLGWNAVGNLRWAGAIYPRGCFSSGPGSPSHGPYVTPRQP